MKSVLTNQPVSAGPALALALGIALMAEQTGAATTYTVPLQFSITLGAPVCSLKVDSATADNATPLPLTGVTLNLTPTPLPVADSPNGIVSKLAGFDITANGAGVFHDPAFGAMKFISTPPTASATCEPGTPLTARIAKASTAVSNTGITSAYMAGAPGSGQSGTLPIGMLMGLWSFADTPGTTGSGGTTLNAAEPYVTTMASGGAQTLTLAAAVYANSDTVLTAEHAGLWTYSFNVHLDF